MNLTGLIKHCSGSVSYRMVKIRSCPVKYRHEIVTDYFYAKFSQITDRLDIIGNILVSGRQTNLDIIVYIYRFYYIHIKSVWFQLFLYFTDFFLFPHFSRLLIVQSPDNAGHTGNLSDIGKGNHIIPFAIPAKPHLHRHNFIPPLFYSSNVRTIFLIDGSWVSLKSNAFCASWK